MAGYDHELDLELGSDLEEELGTDLEGDGEEELSGLSQGIGGLIGLGETDLEEEVIFETDLEVEGEELFFKKAFRRIGGFVKKAAPMLRSIAKVAAPMVGTAIGGPLGGVLGKAASSMLEIDHELDMEDEVDLEIDHELDMEDEAGAPVTYNQALAEYLGTVASGAATEAEAEAMAGAAAVAVLSPEDRGALRAVLPNMVRGVSILTRVLRERPALRPAVRIVPTVMRRTARILTTKAKAGQPITKARAARTMAIQTKKVLASPKRTFNAMKRNVKAARTVSKISRARAAA